MAQKRLSHRLARLAGRDADSPAESSKAWRLQWYGGHAAELAQHQIDVRRPRAESRIFAPKLEESARRFWRDWINAGFRLTAAP